MLTGFAMSQDLPPDSQGKIIVFGSKEIRRAWLDDQWYFSVVDIIGALTDSASPPKYWDAMKRREKESSGFDLSTLCRKVSITGADGKTYKSDAVNTESAFRLIQSIPSPKAEPFKQWLAQVGYQRIQEIENPQLRHPKRGPTNCPALRTPEPCLPNPKHPSRRCTQRFLI